MNVNQTVKPVSKETGYTLKAAASLLGISIQTIRNYITQGLIKKQFYNSKIFLTESDLKKIEEGEGFPRRGRPPYKKGK